MTNESQHTPIYSVWDAKNKVFKYFNTKAEAQTAIRLAREGK